MSTFWANFIALETECRERLKKIDDGNENDEDKMIFTLLSRKALAKCWAPSSPISLYPRFSLVSVWVKDYQYNERDEWSMTVTVLIRSISAKCWAPSELMSLLSRQSVLSVWEKLALTRRKIDIKWHSLYFEAAHQPDIEPLRLQFHCFQDWARWMSKWKTVNAIIEMNGTWHLPH
jgi:hypothetical protein